MQVLHRNIRDLLNDKLLALENHFRSDVIFYFGEIHPAYLKTYRDFIEKLKNDNDVDQKRLAIMLKTPGGSAETAEKMVEITRHHYKEVYFIVPDYAMSAGTIFCMSGDKIYMDYSSSLGPIDPQLQKGDKFVPALGYLDKVEEMLEKAKAGTLTQAEFLILQGLDLAELKSYESAKALTIELLKEWLVKYKFKNWRKHQTDQSKKGQTVTKKEKEDRAEKIAELLSDNKIWLSHNRFISYKTLTNLLRLKIDDYSSQKDLQKLIRSYNDLVVEFINSEKLTAFLHHKYYF